MKREVGLSLEEMGRAAWPGRRDLSRGLDRWGRGPQCALRGGLTQDQQCSDQQSGRNREVPRRTQQGRRLAGDVTGAVHGSWDPGH